MVTKNGVGGNKKRYWWKKKPDVVEEKNGCGGNPVKYSISTIGGRFSRKWWKVLTGLVEGFNGVGGGLEALLSVVISFSPMCSVDALVWLHLHFVHLQHRLANGDFVPNDFLHGVPVPCGIPFQKGLCHQVVKGQFRGLHEP